MDWNTLLSVVIGGLIATIGSIINSRFQAQERIKDREEQRREAKTQLALELMRRDIKIMVDVIDNTLKSQRVIELTFIRKIRGELSEDEMQREIHSIDGKYMKLGETDTIADKLSFTFGNEFYTEYQNFKGLTNSYKDLYMKDTNGPFSTDMATEQLGGIVESAGKLHTILQEKLISLRDT